MTDYVTVFDISKQRFEWWWAAVGLLILVLGIAFIKFGPKWPGLSNAKLIGTLLVGLGVFAVVVDYFEISAWTKMRSAYERRKYSTVEGPVHNFMPMPFEGHQDECFSVDSQQFCYSDYSPQPEFHRSTSHGGPIREGLPVKVAYYEEQILRLEVRADSLTPEAVRTANSKAEEAKWQERAMNDPKMDHMLLVFRSPWSLFRCFGISAGGTTSGTGLNVTDHTPPA